ncbi:MAG: hypothetical protein H6813_02585 [Phycisphaeraceae bacterium]|nr:hypothetical protein [Phycisphaeraceae bacterium]MCB9848797.1 hypothetical protein [Phycisphaeraceae bacterium]
MAEARQRSEWGRTSTLLALIANAHRDAKKTRAFKPSDFDPFARRERTTTNDMAGLRAVFMGRTTGTTDSKEASDGA